MNNQDARIHISIQNKNFDINNEIADLTQYNKNIGAIISFVGLCRDEAGTLKALELEHYPAMAEKQIKKIVQQALQQWPLEAITIIHRYGLIPAGDNIVLVITASQHRLASFQSAHFIMDYLKTDAPFWKKEHLKNDPISNWVAAKEADQITRDNWQNNK